MKRWAYEQYNLCFEAFLHNIQALNTLLTNIIEFATDKTFSTLQMSYLAAIFSLCPLLEDMLAYCCQTEDDKYLFKQVKQSGGGTMCASGDHLEKL